MTEIQTYMGEHKTHSYRVIKSWLIYSVKDLWNDSTALSYGVVFLNISPLVISFELLFMQNEIYVQYPLIFYCVPLLVHLMHHLQC